MKIAKEAGSSKSWWEWNPVCTAWSVTTGHITPVKRFFITPEIKWNRLETRYKVMLIMTFIFTSRFSFFFMPKLIKDTMKLKKEQDLTI